MSDLHKFPLPLEKFKTIQIVQKYLQNTKQSTFTSNTQQTLTKKSETSKRKTLGIGNLTNEVLKVKIS